VHERHRWFGVDAIIPVVVRAKRRAVVLVSQPPGEETFDRRVDDLLGRLDPTLKPVLVGPKPDWLRDRFGTEAHADQAPPAESVFVVAAGPRRRRLELRARELRFESWRGNYKASSRTGSHRRSAPVKQILLGGLAMFGIATGAAAGGLIDLDAVAAKGNGGLPKAQHSILRQLESVGDAPELTAADVSSIRR
jgi:hypothetical protein